MDAHSWILCIPFFCFVVTILVGVTGVIIYFTRKKSEPVTLPSITNIITEETEEDLSPLDKVEDEIPEDKIPIEQDINWTILEEELKKQDPAIDTLGLEFEETDTESDEPIPRPLIKPTKRDRTSNLKKAEDLLKKHFPVINRIKKFKLKLI